MFKARHNKRIAFSDNSNLRFSVVRRGLHIFSNHKRGIALFLVLGTLLVVTILATVILSLILSHARLTHHQTSRIQAYYAALAGMNLATEKLRTGAWGASTYHLCKSGCSDPDVNDSDMPYQVDITISDPDANGIRTIKLTTNYTYTP